MSDAQGATPPSNLPSPPNSPSVDDTAAFQRFYAGGSSGEPESRGLLYRLLIGWWRDRPQSGR